LPPGCRNESVFHVGAEYAAQVWNLCSITFVDVLLTGNPHKVSKL
jgi:hypothetical protein